MNNEFNNRSYDISIILLECPVTTELFQKVGYDFNSYNNIKLRDISYNTEHRDKDYQYITQNNQI